MKRFVASIWCVLLIVLFVSCYRFTSEEYLEAKSLSRYILDNISNDDIYLGDIYTSDSGIRIELYGSNLADDVISIIDLSNEWINENEYSIIVINNLRVNIDIYLERPEQKDRDNLNYVAELSNYSFSYDREVNNALDCIEIRQCPNLSTSLLDNGCNYRVIVLPIDVNIDEFVFTNMDSLEYLVFRDYWNDAIVVSESEYSLQIADFTSEYADINFTIEVY